ncbi:MAG: AAA family ATPase [Flavobacteriales bacterium]|nr:AAA family ATPase [Flavobacteriales bacterium]
MIYKKFRIQNYKGIKDVEISLVKDDLVLLLGLNESGKTTILKAIETFDYLNDLGVSHNDKFYKDIRNKSDVNSNEPAIITATIEIDESLDIQNFKKSLKKHEDFNLHTTNIEGLFRELNKEGLINISRVIPFKNGNPQPSFYQIDSEHPFTKNKFSKLVAKEIVRFCQFIIYFEDFKDRIPEKIFTSKSNDSYNPDWYDIIDGLFYNTNKDYSIEQFKTLNSVSNPRPKDAKTVLKRVNKTLNKSFSEKWKELSGVKDIEETELTYNIARAYFEISITDTDGTTFSVDERSKGALWYLSFLMKTEFRRKKLRKNYGKPVLLIDEPASNLHSSAQQNMIEDFQKLVEDTSVIYSTHSQYLISLDNIKTTYVIERDEGEVTSTLWADYIKLDTSDETYYQPLSNILKLVPNTFDIPWNKAIITEGPSDMKVLQVMYDILHPNEKIDFVIYPGASAQKLSSLISLNIGWGANFKVLLDSDDAGKEAQKNYIEQFDLSEDIIIILPEDNKNIEKYFTKEEQIDIYEIAFDRKKDGNVNKKEFSASFSILNSDKIKRDNMFKKLSSQTKKRFVELFKRLS